MTAPTPRSWLVTSLFFFLGLPIQYAAEIALGQEARSAGTQGAPDELVPTQEQVDEMLEQLPSALESARLSEDEEEQAQILSTMGALEMGKKQEELAMSHFRQALELVEEDGDPLLAGALSLSLGARALWKQDLGGADPLLRAAIEKLQSAQGDVAGLDPLSRTIGEGVITALLLEEETGLDPAPPFDVMVSSGIAYAYLSIAELRTFNGRLTEADAAIKIALERSVSLDRVLRARVLKQEGQLQLARGKVSQAVQILKSALDLVGGLDCDVDRPGICPLLIVLLGTTSRLPGSEDRQIVSDDLMARAAKADPALATLTLPLGIQGNLGAGEPQASAGERTAHAETETASPPPVEVASRKLMLGQAAIQDGRYEQAVAHLMDALRALPSGSIPLLEGQARLFLGKAYWGLEQLQRAQEELAQAEKLLSQVEDNNLSAMLEVMAAELRRELSGYGDSTEVVEKLLGLSTGRQETSRLEELIRNFGRFAEVAGRGDLEDPSSLLATVDELLTQALGIGDRSLLGAVRVIRSVVLCELDRCDESRREIQGVLAEADGRGDLSLAVLALDTLRSVDLREGKSELALGHLRDAIAHFERSVDGVQIEEFLASFAGQRRDLYEDVIATLSSMEKPLDALAYSERARSRALLRLLGNQRLNATRGGDPGLVSQAERLRERRRELEKKRAAGAGDESALAAEAGRLRVEYDEILLRLKLSNPQYADLAAVDPLPLKEIQPLLAPGTSLINYFTLPTETLAWVIDREQVRLVRLPIGKDALRAAVERLREEVASRQPLPTRGVKPLPPAETAMSVADELFRQLWAPLRHLLRSSRVIVVPHDALHSLPFVALRDPESGRFVLEDFELSYAPSTSALGLLYGRSVVAAGRALVVGDPMIPGGTLPSLSGARAEAEAVARRLDTRPLLGAAATETALREQARGASLLHVAAHAVLLPNQPRFSYLALAADGIHDGKLEMHEIFEELNLEAAPLVVLSACETALGKRTDGDEIVGLIRAFLYAGSPAVLATLWSIDDDASATLMDRFYQRLLAGGSAAEALRQAQLQALREPGHEASYFWAAFALTGGR